MSVVVIEAPALGAEQKTRIGERIITALQHEGINPGSVVVMFRPEQGDMYLDGYLIQAQATPAAAPAPAARTEAARASAPAPEAEPERDFKTKARRSKPELQDLKQKLMQALQQRGSLSSFEAQEALGLKDCDWAPATLRRLFTDLEDARLIVKSGQKRGTRYLWKGIASTQQTTPSVKLVKAESEEG